MNVYINIKKMIPNCIKYPIKYALLKVIKLIKTAKKQFEKKVKERKKNRILKENNKIKNANLYPAIMKDPIVVGEKYYFDWEDLYYELRDNICNKNFEIENEKLLDYSMTSNGSQSMKKLKLRFGIVADEFVYRTYENAVDLVYLTPDNYVYDIDYLFVVTAWRGLNNEWAGLGNPNNIDKRSALYKIISHYKKQNTKVLFYSKEDPGNYYVFLDIAKKCDYIFTSAEECKKFYIKDTGNNNVYVLDFSINPIEHNPIGMRYNQKKEALFAGTWWNIKYPERKIDMDNIFERIISFGIKLNIVDRNFSRNIPAYFYPGRYIKYVSPSIEYGKLLKIAKLYTYSININTSKSSETMFATRVYEMQALGRLIISNSSIGMEKKFPNILVGENIEYWLQKATDEEIYERQLEGVRNMMSSNTVYDRLKYIFEIIDEDISFQNNVVGIISKEEDISDIKLFIDSQTYKFFTILNIETLENSDLEKVCSIMYWNKNCEYGKYYIEDMMNAFKYVNCDYITKDAYFHSGKLKDGKEHQYVDGVPNPIKSILWSEKLDVSNVKEENFRKLVNGYSIDHFNFNYRGDI